MSLQDFSPLSFCVLLGVFNQLDAPVLTEKTALNWASAWVFLSLPLLQSWSTPPPRRRPPPHPQFSADIRVVHEAQNSLSH